MKYAYRRHNDYSPSLESMSMVLNDEKKLKKTNLTLKDPCKRLGNSGSSILGETSKFIVAAPIFCSQLQPTYYGEKDT